MLAVLDQMIQKEFIETNMTPNELDDTIDVQPYHKGLGILAYKNAEPFHTLPFNLQKDAIIHFVKSHEPCMCPDIIVFVMNAKTPEDLDKLLQAHTIPGGKPVTSISFTSSDLSASDLSTPHDLSHAFGFKVTQWRSMVSFEFERMKKLIELMNDSGYSIDDIFRMLMI